MIEGGEGQDEDEKNTVTTEDDDTAADVVLDDETTTAIADDETNAAAATTEDDDDDDDDEKSNKFDPTSYTMVRQKLRQNNKLFKKDYVGVHPQNYFLMILKIFHFQMRI